MEASAPQLQSILCSLQFKKFRAQQQRPSAAKNKINE